jgi:uncharacterized membrane protein
MNNCVVVSQENEVVKAYMKSDQVKTFLEKVIDPPLTSHILMSRLVFLMSNLSKLYIQENFLPLLIKFFDRLLWFFKEKEKKIQYSLIDLNSLFHLAHYFLSIFDFDLYLISQNFTTSNPNFITSTSIN